MGYSVAQHVARLPEPEREELLAGLDMDKLLWDWGFWARTEQQPPDGDWAIWLFMAGRGAGKTRTAAEWIREKARYTNQGVLRFTLVARTAADTRDVMVEGESGILNICPPSERPMYEPSKRRLTWPNGNTGTLFSGDEPDSLRGPQSHYAWIDELAAHRQISDALGLSGFDNARIGNRLGRNPQMIITTTPKKVAVMRSLLREAEEKPGQIVITRGKTSDNAGNLAEAYLEGIYGVYGGTSVARQELEGLMLDDTEGALWTEKVIDDFRVTAATLGLPIRVVGVDPSVAENPRDECGIVVVASTGERELYKRQAWVLEDASMHGAPDKWAERVVQTARRWGCPVVAEINQGGAMVRNMINGIDPTIEVLEVHSMVGKALRAEPVALAYEQGRVHHLGTLADLESQMTTWVPGETRKSPDRIDALVHALTACLVKPPPGLHGGKLVARSHASRRIPTLPVSAARGRGGRVVTPGFQSRRRGFA